jgi:hypothetical protein
MSQKEEITLSKSKFGQILEANDTKKMLIQKIMLV